ncbi:UFD1 domain-containing protein [Cephalotus follicularis]|uniref:UFD1 domain-containing protein n=1 Tax=Cephalotus follicularis TaxID=3775 RepID=A0A1Q3CDH6_CEPFO|nr:UFD1 domain-containing protein [Cephalotus follicularis]
MANENPHSSAFEQNYCCYPVSFLEKAHLEKGDKSIMPPSALDRLVSLPIDYPMLFELSNSSARRITHCGVLEFVADEGLVYLPYWMMQNMLLQEGDIVQVKSASLKKGTYVKLQPHTNDFLDVSNPKAILETTLRNYSCLTTGDTVMVPYNNKQYYIDIVETKPSSAISIIETDCEVDFAPPLDYKEPEKPASSSRTNKRQPEVEEEPAKKTPKFIPFCGFGRRLDGKPSILSAVSTKAPVLKQHQPKGEIEVDGSKSATSAARKHGGKLIFGSNAKESQSDAAKVSKTSSEEPPQKLDQPKFQAFTRKKYSLK